MKRLFTLIILICVLVLSMSVYAEMPATPNDLYVESEPESVPELELTPQPEPRPPTVRIWKECPEVVPIGYIVTFYSEVQYTEGWIIKYQWERGKDGVFEDIPGEKEPTYSFPDKIESV